MIADHAHPGGLGDILGRGPDAVLSEDLLGGGEQPFAIAACVRTPGAVRHG